MGGYNSRHGKLSDLPEEFLTASTIVGGEVDVHIVVLSRQWFLHKRLVEHLSIYLYGVLGLD